MECLDLFFILSASVQHRIYQLYQCHRRCRVCHGHSALETPAQLSNAQQSKLWSLQITGSNISGLLIARGSFSTLLHIQDTFSRSNTNFF